jgi:hypothetical protein
MTTYKPYYQTMTTSYQRAHGGVHLTQRDVAIQSAISSNRTYQLVLSQRATKIMCNFVSYVFSFSLSISCTAHANRAAN